MRAENSGNIDSAVGRTCQPGAGLGGGGRDGHPSRGPTRALGLVAGVLLAGPAGTVAQNQQVSGLCGDREYLEGYPPDGRAGWQIVHIGDVGPRTVREWTSPKAVGNWETRAACNCSYVRCDQQGPCPPDVVTYSGTDQKCWAVEGSVNLTLAKKLQLAAQAVLERGWMFSIGGSYTSCRTEQVSRTMTIDRTYCFNSKTRPIWHVPTLVITEYNQHIVVRWERPGESGAVETAETHCYQGVISRTKTEHKSVLETQSAPIPAGPCGGPTFPPNEPDPYDDVRRDPCCPTVCFIPPGMPAPCCGCYAPH